MRKCSFIVRHPIVRVHKRTCASQTNTENQMPFKSPVGNTALWTAWSRSVSSAENKPIMVDPYAKTLAGEEGKKVYEHYAQFSSLPFFATKGDWLPEFNDNIAVRTRFFDEFLLDNLSSGGGRKQQVVLLASGLDSRAFRLQWPANTFVYEVDQKEVLEWKMKKLKSIQATPKCHQHTLVHANLTDPSWTQQLLQRGYESKTPTIWIAEGLVTYIPQTGVKKLLKTLHDFTSDGSSLGFDVPSAHEFPSILGESPLYAELERLGNPFVFSLEDPKTFVEGCGWKNVLVNEKGDSLVNYSKQRQRVPPKWLKFIPRQYLVRAFK